VELSQPDRLRGQAAFISLIVSVGLLSIKFWAYFLTSSQAIFSDAMESIVNVVAALLALIIIRFSRQPADREHPYGHGKAEYFSQAFEGVLISFAAILIIIEATQALYFREAIAHIDMGLILTAGAGLVNLILGLFLLYRGKRYQSPALVASGKHIVSDVVTTVGVLVGLGLVALTGLWWLDALAAIFVGIHLAWVGGVLVKESFVDLMDAEDRGLISQLEEVLSRHRKDGIIHIHHLRVMRSGRYHHIDAHVVVPEVWDVGKAHDFTQRFEQRVIQDYPFEGEMHFHVDPCRRAYCRFCNLADCPVRQSPFVEVRPLKTDELLDPEEPEEFQ
jgi:cation diffusion facilitator family transporter